MMFGVNIFKISRQASELSIREAARELGVSPTTVQNVERGSDLRLSTIFKFSEFYNLNFGAAVASYWPLKENKKDQAS